jgi:hypothetical protein
MKLLRFAYPEGAGLQPVPSVFRARGWRDSEDTGCKPAPAGKPKKGGNSP